MIYLCTTFREFNGSRNDEIQRLFLKSIKEQSNQNYKLIVTTFGEKTVSSVIESEFPNKSKVIDVHLENYRYSLTDVLINCIEEALLGNNILILWCTCDIILQNNFFDVLEKINTFDLAGICHPHFISNTPQDYENNIITINPLRRGIDIMFFNSEIFRNDKYFSYIKNYRNYDWGAYENFLAGVAKLSTKNRKNIFLLSRIYKIENDRVVNNETQTFLNESQSRNIQTLKSFIKNEKCTKKIMDMLYCHYLYKIIPGESMVELKQFRKLRFLTYLRIIKNTIRSFIPRKTRKRLKGLIHA
ncbi:MAG: hypothetical protein LBO80_10725 [Treponema sp.]|jgi:hypothetical protein|nr:hypothetical protein [Treponema sp.]